MLRMISARLVSTVIMMLAVSIVAFILMQLPSAATDANRGGEAYRLAHERPLYVQYFDWIGGVLQGDFGWTYVYRRPVSSVIGERLGLTLALAFSTLLFTYLLGLPIGIYSAVRQYSIGDHAMTVLGYIGLATPNFMLALILVYLAFKWFGLSAGGLFSPEFQEAEWSLARFWDMLAHLWVPVVVLGTSGTAFQMRTMRATLLDEINKMYVIAARAGGISEFRLLMKYPVRVALNPIVSTLGWELTNIISGAPIVAMVLSLPDTGPLFLKALMDQDMDLVGAMILIYCTLVVIGSVVSDLLLIWLDPRIRLEAAR